METEELLANLNHCTGFGENRGCRWLDCKHNPSWKGRQMNTRQESQCIYSRNTEMNAGSQLASSLLFSLKLKSMGRCCPHSDWVFPGQLDLSRNTLINVSRDVFPC